MRLSRPAVIAACLVLVACDSNNSPRITAPVPTAPTIVPATTTSVTASTAPTTSSTSTSASTATSTSTVATAVDSTSPSTTGVPGVIGGTVVDSAPGVNSPGEIRELLPKLWVFIPSAPDPADIHVQVPLPADIEIIAAYVEERTALYELITQRPNPSQPSPRLVASRRDGAQSVTEGILKPDSQSGVYYDLAEGLVLRPVVIADPRSETEAFIFDCQLDASVRRNADGSLVDGEVPGVKRFPQIARMVKVDGRWVVDVVSKDDRVCA